MLHHKKLTTHYHIVIPALLMLFLTFGTIITVNQTKQISHINSNAAATNCSISATGFTTKTQEQTLLMDINTYRTQHSLKTLTLDSTLKQSSDWLSVDMASHNTLSHVDSLNRTPDMRLSNCGYSVGLGYGENIAEGSTDPGVVFNAWKNDPPHNAILLDPKYTITGISMELNKSGTAFWTMDLGVGQANNNPNVTTMPTATAIPLPTAPKATITPINNQNSPTVVVPPSITPNDSPIFVSPSDDVSPSVSPSIQTDFPTPTTGPVTADMQIGVSIKINGIGQGGTSNPVHKTRHVTAFIFDASNNLAATGNAFLNYDGSNYFTGTIHLGKLSQGPYFIKLASDYTLQVLAKPEFQNLRINQLNTIPPVTLYMGDMTADNILDINDYNQVLPCFQSIPVCANASLIDFNDDGTTDVKDYNLFLNSFEILHGN